MNPTAKVGQTVQFFAQEEASAEAALVVGTSGGLYNLKVWNSGGTARDETSVPLVNEGDYPRSGNFAILL